MDNSRISLVDSVKPKKKASIKRKTSRSKNKSMVPSDGGDSPFQKKKKKFTSGHDIHEE
jgi:hypothetical protein